MRRVGGRLVLSATDLTKHLACAHVTTLDLAELDEPDPPVPAGPDDALDLVFAKGIDHEEAYLARLEAAGRQVVHIGGSGPAAAEQTLAAMAAGADVVYQGVLAERGWTGTADFLLRRECPDEPSRFGPWRYDLADTKLARRLEVPALLQMASYAERLAHLQDVPPADLVVVAGDGQEHRWAWADVRAYARRASARLESAVARTGLLGPDTRPVPVPHCKQCRWSRHCAQQWEDADDLALVAGMRSSAREALRAAGIETLQALAEADVADVTAAIGGPAGRKLHRQAGLQLAERRTGSPAYELLPHQRGLGLDQLPAPHPDDVYLDFEGDPWANGGAGLEYLAGLSDRRGGFHTWWAHDPAQEKLLLERLVDDLTARVAASPGMHVYHYAPYERTALTRLAGRYGTRESAVDDLLRDGVLVDLFAVVRQSLRISKSSYSIKKLEAFYWAHTRTAAEGEVADALSSVVEYEKWLQHGRPGTLEAIARYNEQDCLSTLALHEWLEQRRAEAAGRGDDLTRPEERAASLDRAAAEKAEARRAGLSAEEADENEVADALRAAGDPLMAACVGWHRREARPQWWEYFRYGDLSTEDLVADPKTLGGLEAPEHVRDVLDAKGRRVTSKVWRYAMPPQEYAGAVGAALPCVDTHVGMGTLVAFDPVAGWAEFSRGAKADPVPARAAGVPGPIDDSAMRAALRRTGRDLLAGSRGGAGGALLRGDVPDAADLAPREGESAADVVVRVGRGLHGQVLAVQGPPGTGKTTAASALIRALLDDGRTVGVTALSHAVIGNLLDAVGRPGLQKTGSKAGRVRGEVEETGDTGRIVADLADGRARLVGGTAWLWSRPELAEAVDVLVVDEAGQFSLANAIAAAGCARSVVLLGDPQQLTQPTRATHPDGGDVSALQHLIGEHDTIPADVGVFLDRTWRMHPELASFVSELSYEGRLRPTPGREVQRVTPAPGARGPAARLPGAGLAWLPVEHAGNVADSPEEARVVADLVSGLVGGEFVGLDPEGQPLTRPLTLDDVLVVAPFNAHVARLAAALPEGARVGTVDRFQGQEASVVVYAMGSSDADLAPRGVGFLFDLHRLNVAVSRAKALAVLVGSPALLDAPARSPQQVRQINAMCRFVERATPVG